MRRIKNDATTATETQCSDSPLSPCPFCGLTDSEIINPDNMGNVAAVAMHSYPQGYRIECEGCCCNGPWHHQHAEAIEAWNRRANPQLHITPATKRMNTTETTATGSMERMAGHPRRIQLRRKRGWKMPPNTMSVARPSKWANPYCVLSYGRAEAIRLYEMDVLAGRIQPAHELRALAGKNLACYCKESEACHADVLIRLASAAEREK